MDAREATAGYTYRVIYEGKEIEHFHISRVHGRRIYMEVTAFSCLAWRTTRLRWRKMVDGLLSQGCQITVERTDTTPSARRGEE